MAKPNPSPAAKALTGRAPPRNERQPKIVVRKGRTMIEDGSGGWRLVDRRRDAALISEMALNLPQEKMDAILSGMPKPIKPIGATPAGMIPARMFLKNFTNNGKNAQAFIKSLSSKWQVKQLSGNDWDFAVSQDGVRWHLFDPGPSQSTMGLGLGDKVGRSAFAQEAALDLMDLITDTLIGVASGAAWVAGAGAGIPSGPGAIATGAAASGAVGGGLEGVKQLIGKVGGIPDNVDVPDAVALGVITSVFSGAGPYAARGIKAVGGQIKKIPGTTFGKAIRETLLEAGSGLLGIRGAGPTLRPERILERRIADPAGIRQQMTGLGTTAKAMRRMMKRISRRQLPEQSISAALEKEATEAGATVNVKSLVDEFLVPLTDKTVKQGKKTIRVARTVEGARAKFSTEGTMPRKAQEAINRISEILAVSGEDARAVSIETAVAIKQTLRKTLAERNAVKSAHQFTGQKGTGAITQYDQVLTNLRQAIRKETTTSIDALGLTAPDGRVYSEVMNDFDKSVKQLSLWKDHLGVNLPREKGVKKAAEFVKSIHNSENTGFRDAANTLKASTGVDLVEHAEQAMVAELFGEQGVAKVFPRISAMGEPVGVGIGKKAVNLATSPLAMAGYATAGGGLLGGVPGAMAGFAVGGTLASEAGELALARHIGPAFSKAAAWSGRQVGSALNKSSDTRALTVMQSLARQLQQRTDSGNPPEDTLQLKRRPGTSPRPITSQAK